MIRGKPLIQHIIDKVSILGNDLIITSNEPAKFEGVTARIVPDEYVGVGALAGVHSGLKAARNEFVIMVANDMPFINIDLFRYMESLFRPEIDIVIPYSPRGYEPFHAIYRRSACLPAVERAIQNQEKRIISWFNHVNIYRLTGAELMRFDHDDLSFMNINTPADLNLVEKMSRR
jgi:molybdopterin-guanine dinucleotide biosynthesis protein A